MKKLCITFFTIAIIIATIFGTACYPTPANGAQYLRIHVRANSNSDADQSVKYIVKDTIVAYLTPLVSDCHSLSEAMAVVSSHLSTLDEVATTELHRQHADYAAKSRVCRETFPTRVYDDVTLPMGEYDALIVDLGSGLGDNWWCVVYPPLCFTSAQTNVSYRSFFFDLFTGKLF